MPNFRLEAVPELKSDEAALSFGRKFQSEAARAPSSVVFVWDFSTCEPSPTKYNLLAQTIIRILKSRKHLVLAGVSRAVVTTSGLGRVLLNNRLSLPILDRDTGERVSWIGRKPNSQQLRALKRLLPQVLKELEDQRNRRQKLLSAQGAVRVERQLAIAISESGAAIRGHFQLPGGTHTEVALDISRLLDRPETLSAIEATIIANFSKKGVRGVVMSSHAATLSSLVARVSSRLDIQNEFKILEEPDRFRRTQSEWVQDRSPILIITDVVRSGSWCRTAVESVRESGGSIAGAIVVVRNTHTELTEILGSEFPILVLHQMDLPFCLPAGCELCKVGWPYREIRRRDQTITSEYVSLFGERRRFRRGLPLLPLEFWELVRLSGCFRAGHMVVKSNPSVHYQSYFDIAELLNRFGKLIGTRIYDFIGERRNRNIGFIVTTDSLGSKLLGKAVANSFKGSARPKCISIPSSELHRAAIPAYGESAKAKATKRLSNVLNSFHGKDQDYIIADDGINSGATMLALYELLSSASGRAPEACVVVLSRCKSWPTQLRSLIGNKLLYCYDWPIPPHVLISGTCPLDTELQHFTQLSEALREEKALEPYISTKLRDLAISEVISSAARHNAREVSEDDKIPLRGWHDSTFSDLVWDDLTVGGFVHADEFHMLLSLVWTGEYFGTSLPIILEMIAKNGIDALLPHCLSIPPSSLGAVGKALQLSENRITELNPDGKKKLIRLIFDLIRSAGTIEAKQELLAAAVKCRDEFCFECIVSECLRDETLIPLASLLAASTLLPEQIVGEDYARGVIARLRDECERQGNHIGKERLEEFSAMIWRLHDKTRVAGQPKSMFPSPVSSAQETTPTSIGAKFPTKEHVERDFRRLPGATFSQLVANLQRSTDALEAAAGFLNSVSGVSGIGVVFCGSFGRLEAGESSDGDFLMIDFSEDDFEKSKKQNWPLLRDFACWLRTQNIPVSHYDGIVNGKYLNELSPDSGVFPNLSTADSLLRKYGTKGDSVETKTRRMALLLESAAVKGEEEVNELKRSLLKEYGLREDASQTNLPWDFLRDVKWWLDDMERRAAESSQDLLWLKWGFQRCLLCRSTILAIGSLLAAGEGRLPTLPLYLDILSKPPILRLVQLPVKLRQSAEVRESLSKLISWVDLAFQRYGGVNSYLKSDRVQEIDRALAEKTRHDLLDTASRFKEALRNLHKTLRKKLSSIQRDDYDHFN